MANGRMITNLICRDVHVNQLSSDTGRLAFTWLITFADREGRVPGDPAVVRAMVFPRRQDVSIEQMEEIIQEWYSVGLIIWYEAQDDKWIWFPSFDKNQLGLRKDREAPSKIPPPPVQYQGVDDNGTPELRSNAGRMPEELPLKLNEVNVKLKERKGDPDVRFDEIQHIIEDIIHLMPTGEADQQAIRDIVTMGAIREDIQGGYDWVRGANGKAVVRYSTLVNPTRTALAKRLQSAPTNGNGSAEPRIKEKILVDFGDGIPVEREA